MEARQVPVPALRQGGHGPVGGVEDQVGGRERDLQLQPCVGEEDDAEHEHKGGDEAEDTVSRWADLVKAFLRVPVQLACDLLVALDD